jgi:hypothetical protein
MKDQESLGWRIHRTILLLTVLAGVDVATVVEAATFKMKDGSVVEGNVIDNMAGNWIIRTPIGYTLNSDMSDVDTIELKLADGQTLSGALLGFENGVYVIRYENSVIRIAQSPDAGYRIVTITEPSAPVPLDDVIVQPAAVPTAPAPAPEAPTVVKLPSNQPTM